MKPYNYSRKYLDNVSYIHKKSSQAHNKAYNIMSMWIDGCVKYILPINGGLQYKDADWTYENKKRFSSLLRLPYHKVTLEFPTSHECDCCPLAPTILICEKEVGSKLGFIVNEIRYFYEDNEWRKNKFSAKLSQKDIEEWEQKTGEMEFECEGEPQLFQLMVCIQYCIYLNTRKIQIEHILSNKKLNKKRIAHNKNPFFYYKILTIHKNAVKKTLENRKTMGKRKWHQVAGHFRFLNQYENPIWIQDHERGDLSLGIAGKDYKINKMQEEY